MNETRERLIQLLGEAIEPYLDRIYPWDTFSDIADHLIDNGVIVPSVKVGQTVHILPKHDKVIILTAVEWILQSRDEMVYSTGDYEFDNTDIGKTVFFTYAEASAALKVRENSDE